MKLQLRPSVACLDSCRSDSQRNDFAACCFSNSAVSHAILVARLPLLLFTILEFQTGKQAWSSAEVHLSAER